MMLAVLTYDPRRLAVRREWVFFSPEWSIPVRTTLQVQVGSL